MSCNFCRDSIEGLKEVELPSKQNISTTAAPIPQAGSGLMISPNFVGPGNNFMGTDSKLYQCQWCTEYWYKKLSLKITQTEADTNEFGAVQIDFVSKAVPIGYDLDKIKGDLP